MLVYQYRNKDVERTTHLASVRKYVGLDYSPNIIRSDANMILSVPTYLPELRKPSPISFFDEPYMS